MPNSPRAPLKILHVDVPTAVGGMQRVIEALADGQRRRGHDVSLAAVVPGPHEAEPRLLSVLRSAGVAVHAIDVPRHGYRTERARVAQLCRTLGPDVVHTHGYRPDVVDAGAAARLGIPVVTTVHGFAGGDWKNRIYERLQIRAFRRFDAVVAVSRPLAELLARRGVPTSRIHCVPNAWAGGKTPLARADARRALGLPPDGTVIGWVGRLSQEKGADFLLEAAGLMRAPGRTPATVALIGEGPDAVALRARAERLGIADRVSLVGVVPDAGRLFRAFDVFVLSSRTEGTPIVLFEAMSAGVPIVATRVGGVPDVVSETEALVVPPQDPAALAAAIAAVFADPQGSAARVAAAAARLASHFAVDPWLDRYEAVYRGLARRA